MASRGEGWRRIGSHGESGRRVETHRKSQRVGAKDGETAKDGVSRRYKRSGSPGEALFFF